MKIDHFNLFVVFVFLLVIVHSLTRARSDLTDVLVTCTEAKLNTELMLDKKP